ncbi:serine/threonine-protein kinase, partial [Streptomyces albogriseolus]|uniref:serine/threonine-protein kinase n=1 Tax=Streptomyces albogriseolus TaxID=1887 RepID=UPI00345FC7C6
MVDQLTQHDPRRIGPFEVLGRLGAGGMGLVYLARSASGRRVAIKTVRTELAEDQLFRVRFTREVEAARAVSGFYTAAVVDADPRAAVPWLATAYVPAPSLEEIVNECGPLPAQAVRWLAAGVAEALQSIHGAGLVHRDLKPSNVLVVEDGPRVIDFGIASGVSNTRLTMTNVAVGTPAYMSPEQAKDSRSVTGASDVFSLGSMLVFAATGHPPFHGANPVETVFMLLREGPDLEGLPDELRPLIEACMQMDPTARPNPADLQAQLAPHLFGSGSDDSGTASAWLPERAVSLIEARRGGRPARPPQNSGRSGGGAGARPHVPPPPPHDPVVPPPPSQAAPVGAPGTGPVRLAGAAVPIGPGPRVADTRAAAVQAPPPAVALAATWTKPRPGVNGAEPAAASAPPAPAAPPEQPGGWRPWRFRMSNDVWGTPAVAGDLVYVTSFEVHALDVATGRRRFKTRDVAWSMAVADGRIHASDGPTLYALDAREGGDLWRLNTDAWVYSLKADRGTVLTGTRGGGVQGREASTGQKLWELTGCQTDFESPEAGPALFDGTAYVWQDARLRALDARTGEERWSYPIGDAASCGGVPVRLTSAPDGYVYVCAGTRVLALEAASGHVRWHFEAPAVFLCPQPRGARDR